mmetsp:Transcript_26378/g.47355  ORF Transcript_26378/g.47355 Transcript_26378/m.47355 type:complete len:155 (+) Transcript_26378:275-739(+)
MVLVQMMMVRVCVNTLNEFEGKSIWDINHFWNWDDFTNHVQFLAMFTLSFCFITAFFENYPLYFEILGFIALGIEATLGIPQFFKNYKRRSTEGLSLAMIGGWMAGDSLKTVYFVLRRVPPQFLMCGCLQICVDIAILAQFAIYVSKPRDYVPY